MPEESYECEYCDQPWGVPDKCETIYAVVERYLSDMEVLAPTELTALIGKAIRDD